MADENWQQIRKIFDEALRQKPAERQNFVRQACGGKETLLAEVESLFSTFNNLDDFMETPALAGFADVIEFMFETILFRTHFT